MRRLHLYIALDALILREYYRLKSVPKNSKTDRQIANLSR